MMISDIFSVAARFLIGVIAVILFLSCVSIMFSIIFIFAIPYFLFAVITKPAWKIEDMIRNFLAGFFGIGTRNTSLVIKAPE